MKLTATGIVPDFHWIPFSLDTHDDCTEHLKPDAILGKYLNVTKKNKDVFKHSARLGELCKLNLCR